MNSDAAAKIVMLKGSLRCFTCGMLGLLPVIGLPFAFSALWTASVVRRHEKKFWNAARPYRVWGTKCAQIGILYGLGLFALYAVIFVNAAYELF
jgi:hypothetical protein